MSVWRFADSSGIWLTIFKLQQPSTHSMPSISRDCDSVFSYQKQGVPDDHGRLLKWKGKRELSSQNSILLSASASLFEWRSRQDVPSLDIFPFRWTDEKAEIKDWPQTKPHTALLRLVFLNFQQIWVEVLRFTRLAKLDGGGKHGLTSVKSSMNQSHPCAVTVWVSRTVPLADQF